MKTLTKNPKMKGIKTPLHFAQKVRLKALSVAKAVLLVGVFAVPNYMLAQDETSNTENLSLHLNVKNMHLWHGSVVTPGAMLASSIEFNSNNKKFIAGLWGGASFDGSYREFSYYTKYKFTPTFHVSLISHNNYSNSATVDIFSYDKKTSPNFVDIVLEYQLSNTFPLSIYWSTILFGNAQDFETNENEETNDSYSNYAELHYPVLRGNTQLTLFVGGAFSFITDKTFYSQQANLINIGATLRQNVRVFAHKIPVSATAFWNPETKIGALQVDIALF